MNPCHKFPQCQGAMHNAPLLRLRPNLQSSDLPATSSPAPLLGIHFLLFLCLALGKVPETEHWGPTGAASPLSCMAGSIYSTLKNDREPGRASFSFCLRRND